MVAGLIASTWLQSCTDLEEIVYDKIPVDKFGTNDKEMAALVAPIYSSLRGYRDFAPMADESGDMLVYPTRKGGDWWDGGVHMYIKQHTWTNNNDDYVKGNYGNIYNKITTCNKVLKLVEDYKDGPNKARTIAEVRAVRAFWYYMYVDYYGQGPLVTDFTDIELPSPKSRKEIFEFVVSELNAVKNDLREDVNSSSYGKMTKGGALSILAKMYLNAGIWNPAGGNQWQKCIDACNEIMALPYILEPDWKKSFSVNNQESKEIILPIVYKANDWGNTIVHETMHYLATPFLGILYTAWNGMCGDPNYVKEYDPDDKRLNWSFLIGSIIDPLTGKVIMTTHGRPLIHTVDVTMYEAGASNWGWCNQEDGARCYKWEIPRGLQGSLDNDFAIFRLADIYLMKAECLIRLNGPNGAATELVNSIRKRAFLPEKPIANVTLDDLRKERRYEFAWEQYCRQDQIRFGTFLKANPGWRGESDPIRLLFPIPLTAIDVNPKLVQNPGY